MERRDMLDELYGTGGEDSRLVKSRHGQLEYLTTMHYIHQLLPKGSRLVEVGAGTGRYSIVLAREGYSVTAVELVEGNLQVLRQNAAGVENLAAYQGDATDLSRWPDNSFDGVLMLGPMYHLYTQEEQHKALDEAIRVTKPGGMVMAAFLSVYAILYNNYLNGNFRAGLEENFDQEGRVRHFREQLFTGFDVAEFEVLFQGKPVKQLHLAGTDSVLELAKNVPAFCLDDEDFAAFAQFHLRTCEKRELLGGHSHLLWIGRKQTE